MFNFTSDTMMLDDACTCIFLIREVFHFALVDWSTLKFLQGKARALITLMYTSSVGLLENTGFLVNCDMFMKNIVVCYVFPILVYCQICSDSE